MVSKLKTIRITATFVFAIGLLFLLDGKSLYTFVLWPVSAILYGWEYFLVKGGKRALKQEFISRFQQYHLYTANQNPNLVYKVLEKDGDEMKVQIVWSQTQPVQNGKIFTVNPSSLSPFNERNFLKNI